LFIRHGVDINKESKNGVTPLFEACSAGNETISNYSVEHGADIYKENNYGQTSLFSVHVLVEMKI